MSRSGDGFALVLWGLFAVMAGAMVFYPDLGRFVMDRAWTALAGCYGVCK